MSRLVLLVCAVALVGCSMSNKRVVEETKYCRENGMDASVIMNGFTHEVTDIICVPIPLGKERP